MGGGGPPSTTPEMVQHPLGSHPASPPPMELAQNEHVLNRSFSNTCSIWWVLDTFRWGGGGGHPPWTPSCPPPSAQAKPTGYSSHEPFRHKGQAPQAQPRRREPCRPQQTYRGSAEGGGGGSKPVISHRRIWPLRSRMPSTGPWPIRHACPTSREGAPASH